MRQPKPDLLTDDVVDDWSTERPAAQDIYACKLVTPLYGGGVEAGEVDANMPIRASAIRGQLRFWWRLTRGGSLSGSDLFERERSIFGGIGSGKPTASKVAVRVRGRPCVAADWRKSDGKSRGVAYAYGPAAIDTARNWLNAGYEFNLELTYPDALREEVLAPLRWWASFGGLGARTRRGFGAVHVTGLDPVSATEARACGGVLRFADRPGRNAEVAWNAAVEKLYQFRQGPDVARKARPEAPGRSFWPEPDQLRRFTDRDANGDHSPVHEAGNVFPRAAFGMPILFHFKGKGEPPDLELVPQNGSDRMASPLVLRPYWTGDGWQPCALLLPGWERAASTELRLRDVRLQRDTDHTPGHWPANQASAGAIAARIAPMCHDGDGQPRASDPLRAFLDYFERG
jgi:CRISPR-associated protein Cmr1